MKNKALKIIAFVVIISTVCCFFASAVSGEGVIAALTGDVATPATPGEATPVEPATPATPATPDAPATDDEPVVDPSTPDQDATPGDSTTPDEDPTEPVEEDNIFVKIIKFIINVVKWVINFIVSTFC